MQEINAQGFIDLLNRHPHAVVVDVRFEHERAEHGIVLGTTNIPLYTPDGDPNPEFADEVVRHAVPGEPIVFVCRSGQRSCEGCEIVKDRNLGQVYSLSEDYLGLVNALTQSGMSGADSPLKLTGK